MHYLDNKATDIVNVGITMKITRFIPEYPILVKLQLIFFPQCESHVSNPYETAVEILDLHILSFMILDNKGEDKSSGKNGIRHFFRRGYTTCLQEVDRKVMDEILYQFEFFAVSFILRFRGRQYSRFLMLPWHFLHLSKRMDELMDLRTKYVTSACNTSTEVLLVDYLVIYISFNKRISTLTALDSHTFDWKSLAINLLLQRMPTCYQWWREPLCVCVCVCVSHVTCWHWYQPTEGSEVNNSSSLQLKIYLKKPFTSTTTGTQREKYLNLLAPELFFLILAHSVYKMWIIQEPNKSELWNKVHFKEKKAESIHHV